MFRMSGETLRKVVKVGNSLGVTIPTEILDSTNIKQGDNISIEIDERGSIVLKKVSKEVLGLAMSDLMKFKGIITEDRAQEWIEEINEMRNQW